MPTPLTIDQLPDGTLATPAYNDLLPRRDISAVTEAQYTRGDTIGALLRMGKVETVAALRALTASTLGDRLPLELLGYYAAGDGGGGLFVYSSSSVETEDGGMIIAPTTGSGRFLRVTSGSKISVKWFGAKGDGSTDDTTALQAAFTYFRAQAPGAVLEFDATGTYLTTQTLLVEGNRLTVEGNQSTIKTTATLASNGVINVGNAGPASASEQVTIQNLRIEADNKAAYGLFVREGQNCSYRNITSTNGVTAAVFVDGSGNGGSITLVNHLFENVLVSCTGVAARGFEFNKGGNTGAFERFTLLGCGGETATNTIAAYGTFGLEILGGTFQNASEAGLRCDDGVTVQLHGTYIEPAGDSVPSLIVDGASKVGGYGVSFSSGIQYDDTSSSVIIDGFSVVSALGGTTTRAVLNKMCDRTDSWGNPVWPTGVSGAIHQKGMRYADKFGTEWICNKSSPYSTWTPANGTFIIPMSYDEIGSGKLWWWAMEDFVVSEMLFVVTETFSGSGLATGFGNVSTNQQGWFSLAQLAVANLTAGAVINASNNVHADNLLGGVKKKYLAGKGGNSADPYPSAIAQYGDYSGWTAGKGFILVRGYNLKFN